MNVGIRSTFTLIVLSLAASSVYAGRSREVDEGNNSGGTRLVLTPGQEAHGRVFGEGHHLKTLEGDPHQLAQATASGSSLARYLTDETGHGGPPVSPLGDGHHLNVIGDVNSPCSGQESHGRASGDNHHLKTLGGDPHS